MVNSCDEKMGGVDVMDRLLGSYRPRLRNKEWYWNLFSNVLNVAVVASWRAHQEVVGKGALDHLTFRRHITSSLLKSDTR